MTDNKDAKTYFVEGMQAFAGNTFDRCVTLLDQAIERDAQFKLALVSRGAAHLKLERPDRAIADFDRALEIDSDYARAYHLRGLAHEKQGSSDQSLADFNRAIELDPDYGAAYYSRASLHTALGNEAEAMEDIEMVTHFTQRNLESFNNLHNVWQTHQMSVENAMETELNR